MATAPQASVVIYRFGDFEFRPDVPELRKFGLRVKLERKPLLLLSALLERRGEVIGREELQGKLWPGNTFVDFDLGLNVAIKKLRDALADSAENPKFIETLVGSGYRFIATVSAEAAPLRTPAVAIGPVPVAPISPTGEVDDAQVILAASSSNLPQRQSFQRAAWLWAAVAVFLLMAGIAYRWRTAHSVHFAAQDWVLITNFDNRTGEAVLDGTLETALRRELSDSRFVSVAPSERVSDTLRLMKRPPGTRVDAAIGREICLRDGNIQAMLTGRIEKLGGKYVVTAFIVNPANGVTLAAEEQQAGSQADLLAATHRLADSILRSLGQHEGEIRSNDEKLEKATTPSLEALSLYSKAIVAMRTGDYWDGQAEAEQLLRQAVQRDPQFASALNLLAWTIHNQHRQKEEYLPLVDRAFNLAGRVSDQEAQFIRATYYEFHGDFDRAIAAYEAVAQAYPDDYWSANNVLRLCATQAREEEAARWAARMAELRPNDPGTLLGAWRSNYADRTASRRYFERLLQLRNAGVPFPESFPVGFDWYRDVLQRADRDDIDGALAEAKRLGPGVAEATKGPNYGGSLPANFAVSLGRLRAADQLIDPTRWWDRLMIAVSRGDSTTIQKIAAAARNKDAEGGPLAAALLARSGHPGEARLVLGRLLAGNPNGLPVWQPWMEGSIALAERQPAAAVPKLRKAVEHFSVERQYGLLFAAEDLARALDQTGQTDEAIRVVEPLEKDHRFNIQTGFAPGTDRLLLAKLYRKVGRIDDAKRVEGELLALWKYADPDFQPLIQLKRQAGIQ